MIRDSGKCSVHASSCFMNMYKWFDTVVSLYKMDDFMRFDIKVLKIYSYNFYLELKRLVQKMTILLSFFLKHKYQKFIGSCLSNTNICWFS